MVTKTKVSNDLIKKACVSIENIADKLDKNYDSIKCDLDRLEDKVDGIYSSNKESQLAKKLEEKLSNLYIECSDIVESINVIDRALLALYDLDRLFLPSKKVRSMIIDIQSVMRSRSSFLKNAKLI